MGSTPSKKRVIRSFPIKATVACRRTSSATRARPIAIPTLLITGMFSLMPSISTRGIESPLRATRPRRDAIMPTSFRSVARSLTKSYSSRLNSGLRFNISKNFFGSHGPNHAMRTTRNPSAPMSETFSAMYTFMPWMRAVTTIRVVVARMMPSRVRKLRSLFLRSESSAIRLASQKEAVGRNFPVLATEVYSARRLEGGVCSLNRRISVRFIAPKCLAAHSA